MKLIWCPHCGAAFSLSPHKLKSCDCGRCSGRYQSDRHHAVVNGEGYSLGLSTRDLYVLVARHDPDDTAYRMDLSCWARPHSDPEFNPRTVVDRDLT